MESRSRKTIPITLVLTGLVTFVSGQTWVRTSTNARPHQHMFSGNSVDKYGHTLYVCKAWHSSGYQAGKTWISNGRLVSCKIPGWNQRRVSAVTFDVLTKPPEADYRLEWSGARCVWGSLPSNGVKSCGRRYVGRNGPSGDHRIGTFSSAKAAFYYTIDGVEHWRKCGFQILLKHGRQIDRYEVFNVEYDFSKASFIFDPDKIRFGHRITNNNSPFDTISVLEWTKTVKKTNHWSQTEGMEINGNIAMTFNAGIPTVGEFGVNAGSGWSETSSDTYGETHEVSETVSHSERISVPPNSSLRVYLYARKANIRIPYTSSVRVVFADGGLVNKYDVKGIYEGTDVTYFETSLTGSHLRD